MNKSTSDELVSTMLSGYQCWYWKDPEHARALQRDKYKRYPDKIYAMNRAWQEKNKEHWKMLVKFGNAIHKAKVDGDFEKESQLRAAREEYKRARKSAKMLAEHGSNA